MANNTLNREQQGGGRPRGSRRRKPGVPVMLVIVLMIMSLLIGGLGGFAVARKTDTHAHALQEAQEKITALENTLTVIGYPAGQGIDPRQWLYDNSVNNSALEDLDGVGWEEDAADDLWVEDSLLDGTLPEDTDPVVVAEFEGGQLMSNEVIPEYNDQLTTLIFGGHDANEVAEATLNGVLEQLAGDKVIAIRAAELGLTELSEAELNQLRQQAEQTYETRISDYMAFADDASLTREDVAARLRDESGVTVDSILETLKQALWTQKFYDHIVKDVTVTDDEVQAHYDALLAKQKQEFDNFPENFEYAHQTGQLIVYRPAGYRAVRDVLIAFEDDEAALNAANLIAQLEQGDAPEDARQQLDALYAPLEKTAKKAEDALAGGKPFTELMDEYGCDPALREEPMRSQGYYVSSDSYVNSAEYVEGAMMLEQPGQVSSPLRSEYGLHLVEYIGDVAPGEVPLNEIRDAVQADALKEKQEAYYAQQRKALLEAAQVRYYPERLR